MPMFLLAALGWLRKVFSTLVGVVVRYPLQCALVAALALAGLFYWRWDDAASDRDAALKAIVQQQADFAAASDEARRNYQAALDAKQKHYDANAKQGDTTHAELVGDIARLTADKLRAEKARGSSCRPATASQGDASGVHQDMPADAIMVSERDVQACGEWVAFGVAAHDWAVGLGEVAR